MRMVVAVCVALATVAAAGCGGGPTPERPRSDATGLTTYHDPARRFIVSFPNTWRRSTRSLTPSLADPKEILAVGTGRFAVEPEGCAHMPVGALEALGPDDVLVTLLERRGLHERGMPARPRRFALGPANASEASTCLSHLGTRRTYWLDFQEHGRSFYALVAVGSRHAADQLAQARRMLDSLRIEPRAKAG